ncbi:OB-fold domain-containing protein [Rhodococcus opacus]|nr:OB-fold domain-containing protein [Rhodococcus opacus]
MHGAGLTPTIAAASPTIAAGTVEYVLCLHGDATESASSWTQSTGSGTIYSYSTNMCGPTPVWATIVPYTVGFAEMNGGYTLFAQIGGESDAIAIGNPVTTRFVQRGEQKLPVFTMTDHQ